ncbi:hypothetical protein AB6A40_008096 [Gnathostoma spinigerum]|uniref:Uncharacterized protein n=1 Tax=Gnathostoma spinigerum TaxID=75299 RepID=A0ABD6EQF4_9BILA
MSKKHAPKYENLRPVIETGHFRGEDELQKFSVDEAFKEINSLGKQSLTERDKKSRMECNSDYTTSDINEELIMKMNELLSQPIPIDSDVESSTEQNLKPGTQNLNQYCLSPSLISADTKPSSKTLSVLQLRQDEKAKEESTTQRRLAKYPEFSEASLQKQQSADLVVIAVANLSNEIHGLTDIEFEQMMPETKADSELTSKHFTTSVGNTKDFVVAQRRVRKKVPVAHLFKDKEMSYESPNWQMSFSGSPAKKGVETSIQQQNSSMFSTEEINLHISNVDDAATEQEPTINVDGLISNRKIQHKNEDEMKNSEHLENDGVSDGNIGRRMVSTEEKLNDSIKSDELVKGPIPRKSSIEKVRSSYLARQRIRDMKNSERTSLSPTRNDRSSEINWQRQQGGNVSDTSVDRKSRSPKHETFNGGDTEKNDHVAKTGVQRLRKSTVVHSCSRTPEFDECELVWIAGVESPSEYYLLLNTEKVGADWKVYKDQNETKRSLRKDTKKHAEDVTAYIEKSNDDNTLNSWKRNRTDEINQRNGEVTKLFKEPELEEDEVVVHPNLLRKNLPKSGRKQETRVEDDRQSRTRREQSVASEVDKASGKSDDLIVMDDKATYDDDYESTKSKSISRQFEELTQSFNDDVVLDENKVAVEEKLNLIRGPEEKLTFKKRHFRFSHDKEKGSNELAVTAPSQDLSKMVSNKGDSQSTQKALKPSEHDEQLVDTSSSSKPLIVQKVEKAGGKQPKKTTEASLTRNSGNGEFQKYRGLEDSKATIITERGQLSSKEASLLPKKESVLKQSSTGDNIGETSDMPSTETHGCSSITQSTIAHTPQTDILVNEANETKNGKENEPNVARKRDQAESEYKQKAETPVGKYLHQTGMKKSENGISQMQKSELADLPTTTSTRPNTSESSTSIHDSLSEKNTVRVSEQSKLGNKCSCAIQNRDEQCRTCEMHTSMKDEKKLKAFSDVVGDKIIIQHEDQKPIKQPMGSSIKLHDEEKIEEVTKSSKLEHHKRISKMNDEALAKKDMNDTMRQNRGEGSLKDVNTKKDEQLTKTKDTAQSKDEKTRMQMDENVHGNMITVSGKTDSQGLEHMKPTNSMTAENHKNVGLRAPNVVCVSTQCDFGEIDRNSFLPNGGQTTLFGMTAKVREQLLTRPNYKDKTTMTEPEYKPVVETNRVEKADGIPNLRESFQKLAYPLDFTNKTDQTGKYDMQTPLPLPRVIRTFKTSENETRNESDRKEIFGSDVNTRTRDFEWKGDELDYNSLYRTQSHMNTTVRGLQPHVKGQNILKNDQLSSKNSARTAVPISPMRDLQLNPGGGRDKQIEDQSFVSVERLVHQFNTQDSLDDEGINPYKRDHPKKYTPTEQVRAETHQPFSEETSKETPRQYGSQEYLSGGRFSYLKCLRKWQIRPVDDDEKKEPVPPSNDPLGSTWHPISPEKRPIALLRKDEELDPNSIQFKNVKELANKYQQVNIGSNSPRMYETPQHASSPAKLNSGDLLPSDNVDSYKYIVQPKQQIIQETVEHWDQDEEGRLAFEYQSFPFRSRQPLDRITINDQPMVADFETSQRTESASAPRTREGQKSIDTDQARALYSYKGRQAELKIDSDESEWIGTDSRSKPVMNKRYTEHAVESNLPEIAWGLPAPFTILSDVNSSAPPLLTNTMGTGVDQINAENSLDNSSSSQRRIVGKLTEAQKSPWKGSNYPTRDIARQRYLQRGKVSSTMNTPPSVRSPNETSSMPSRSSNPTAQHLYSSTPSFTAKARNFSDGRAMVKSESATEWKSFRRPFYRSAEQLNDDRTFETGHQHSIQKFYSSKEHLGSAADQQSSNANRRGEHQTAGKCLTPVHLKDTDSSKAVVQWGIPQSQRPKSQNLEREQPFLHKNVDPNNDSHVVDALDHQALRKPTRGTVFAEWAHGRIGSEWISMPRRYSKGSRMNRGGIAHLKAWHSTGSLIQNRNTERRKFKWSKVQVPASGKEGAPTWRWQKTSSISNITGKTSLAQASSPQGYPHKPTDGHTQWNSQRSRNLQQANEISKLPQTFKTIGQDVSSEKAFNQTIQSARSTKNLTEEVPDENVEHYELPTIQDRIKKFQSKYSSRNQRLSRWKPATATYHRRDATAVHASLSILSPKTSIHGQPKQITSVPPDNSTALSPHMDSDADERRRSEQIQTANEYRTNSMLFDEDDGTAGKLDESRLIWTRPVPMPLFPYGTRKSSSDTNTTSPVEK